MTIPALYNLLDYSLKKLNMPIIWSYQNAPRVGKPYIAINYTNVDMPDHSIYGQVDANGIAINSAWRRATVELQFYAGEESYTCASKAVGYLATHYSLEQQQRLDVSIGQRLFIGHVPALLNQSQYEDRAIYQFEFNYTEHIEDDVGLIEVVEIEGEYSGALYPLRCRHRITWLIPLIWDDGETIWDDGETFWDGFVGVSPNE